MCLSVGSILRKKPVVFLLSACSPRGSLQLARVSQVYDVTGHNRPREPQEQEEAFAFPTSSLHVVPCLPFFFFFCSVCGLGSVPATCLYFSSFEVLRSLLVASAASSSSPPSSASLPQAPVFRTPGHTPSEEEEEEGQKERQDGDRDVSFSLQSERHADEERPTRKEGDPSASSSALIDLLAGFGAETVSCVLWVPIDVCKERLQVMWRLLFLQ